MDSILVGQCTPFYSEFVGRKHFCVCRGERASRMAKVRKRHELFHMMIDARISKPTFLLMMTSHSFSANHESHTMHWLLLILDHPFPLYLA